MNAERVIEVHSSVPFRYRAKLSWSGRVTPDSGKQTYHDMQLQGQLHPQPYDMASAAVLVFERLRPYLDEGWTIDSLVINRYGKTEA